MSANATDPDAPVTLRLDDRGGAGRIAWLTFDNPAKRNALGLGGKARFIELMEGLRHDETLRAVVLPETRFGIPSGMEAAVLPKLVGWGQAVELVLTGDHIDAAEAHRIGYLQRVVPAAGLDAAVEAWIASLLACGARAVRIQKRLVIDWDRMSTTDAARAGIQAFVDAFRTDEPRRLMTAFVEGRRARRAGAGVDSPPCSARRTTSS